MLFSIVGNIPLEVKLILLSAESSAIPPRTFITKKLLAESSAGPRRYLTAADGVKLCHAAWGVDIEWKMVHEIENSSPKDVYDTSETGTKNC